MTSGHKSMRVLSLAVGLLSFLVGLLMLLSSCFGGTVYVSPDFDGLPQSGVAPLTVQFTSYLGPHTTDCLWSFGDGGTSVEENPGHTYTSPGTYTVTLEATPTYTVKLGTTLASRDAYVSTTCTKKDYIIVQSAPSPDLVIDSVTHSPTSPSIGDPVTFSVTVRNQGAVDAGSFHVLLAGAAASTGGTVLSLAAGASTSLTLYLNLTTNPETFTATADDLNQVPESSETNNTAQDVVNAAIALPDLVIDSVTHSPTGLAIGDSVTFSVTVKNQGVAAAGSFHVLLAGAAASTGGTVSSLASGVSTTLSLSLNLTMSPETFAASADNMSEVTESNEANNSAEDTITVPPATGMALIPAGTFQMGDTFSEGSSYTADELPVHGVYVSAFYMDEYEVTKGLWDVVASWAAAHGYDVGPGSAQGKGPAHPATGVSWYEAVKWANARSEREGLEPCYTVDGGVYRTGPSASPDCNWSANGYRLPTEAEWEKAARGGVEGHRYPWSDTDTIQHARANYGSDPAISQDTSPTRGFHPTYYTEPPPYTSPVGSFAPNGYGLYDMAGNVSEVCWDLYDRFYYASSLGSDPRGPASGSSRVQRGGAWNANANSCRVTNRNTFGPEGEYYGIGFRLARTAP